MKLKFDGKFEKHGVVGSVNFELEYEASELVELYKLFYSFMSSDAGNRILNLVEKVVDDNIDDCRNSRERHNQEFERRMASE